VKTSKHGRTTCQQTKKPIYDRKDLHSDERRSYGGGSGAESSRQPRHMPPLHCTETTGKWKRAIPTRVYHPESTEIPRLRMVQPARSSAKATTRRALKGEPRNSLVKFYLGGDYPLHTRVAQREPPEPRGGARRQGIQIRERAYGRERPRAGLRDRRGTTGGSTRRRDRVAKLTSPEAQLERRRRRRRGRSASISSRSLVLKVSDAVIREVYLWVWD
jgi:hypothetical protein